jgi:hypothetical protein
MSLYYRQQYQLHLIETRLLRSDPRLAGMLGIFGRLSVGQAMPSWEQVSSRKDGIRQAATLLAEAVTIAAAALSVLLCAVLAFGTAVVRGDRARPSTPRHGRTRPPAPKRGRAWAPAPKRDRADPGRKAGGWPDPAGWS